MYEEFRVNDRWSGEELHCRWKGTMVAIATRHADAVDVRFDVNGRPMWIALPLEAWKRQKELTGKVITDQLAAQIAGRFLKQLVEEGYDSRREVYTMTVPEVPLPARRRGSRSQSPGRNADAGAELRPGSRLSTNPKVLTRRKLPADLLTR